MKSFENADERQQLVVAAAAVAFHALLGATTPRPPAKETATLAFLYGEAFIAEAEKHTQ